MLLSVPWPNSRPSDLRVGSLLAPRDLLPYFGEYSFFDSVDDEDDEKVMDIGIGDGTTHIWLGLICTLRPILLFERKMMDIK